MLEPAGLDPWAVRRQFSRRASWLGQADYLLREVESRMFERLDVMRIEPASIVDIGCGLGDSLLSLRRRYQQARAIGIDSSEPVLRHARPRLEIGRDGGLARMLSRLTRRPTARLAELVAADMNALPLAANSVDLIWSNLCLHWSNHPHVAIEQWQRIIRPGGLVMFSLFGVDTLTEIRSAGAELMRFQDMHDIGDALVEAGFADPVMDMNMITVTFSDPARLIADIRALGGNALLERRRGLTGRARQHGWTDRLLQMRDSDGRIPVSFEVCFGHAWCPDPKRLPRGLSRVEFHPRRGGGETGPSPD